MSRSGKRDTFWNNTGNAFIVKGRGWKEGNSVAREEFPRILCRILKLLDIAVQCKGTTNVPLPTSINGFGLVYSFRQSKRTVIGSGKKYAHVLSWISRFVPFVTYY